MTFLSVAVAVYVALFWVGIFSFGFTWVVFAAIRLWGQISVARMTAFLVLAVGCLYFLGRSAWFAALGY